MSISLALRRVASARVGNGSIRSFRGTGTFLILGLPFSCPPPRPTPLERAIWRPIARRCLRWTRVWRRPPRIPKGLGPRCWPGVRGVDVTLLTLSAVLPPFFPPSAAFPCSHPHSLSSHYCTAAVAKNSTHVETDGSKAAGVAGFLRGNDPTCMRSDVRRARLRDCC